MSIADCHQIDLPKIHDPRGNLTFLETNRHVPFEIKRVYYLYDIPGGETRAGHAHKELQQVLIAISGSFDVLLDDGKEKKRVHLDRPFFGLYIHPLTWRVLENFSSGSVCLSIVSDLYAESDYFREYDEFLQAVGEKNK
jgi:oxalate decarboxylase/phosphoglucose isomerase-like protein (cupin superfamily)